MHPKTRSTTQGFAAGAVTGAALGAGLALLFAPRSGAATRTTIGESVDAARQALGERGRQVAAAAEETLARVNRRVRRDVAEPTATAEAPHEPLGR